MRNPPPNVLFIMTDQQFADAMSCRMGDRYLHTPAMDSLAARGTLFRNAYTPHPLCVPARASLITGRYPHELGIMDLDAFGKPHLDGSRHNPAVDTRRFPTIATHFRNAGYETGYIGKWHIPLDIENSQESGFDFSSNILTEFVRNNQVMHGHNRVDHRNAEETAKFLTAPRPRPWFLMVSFNNPHNICEWARGVRGANLPDGDTGPVPPLDECPPAPANLEMPDDETDILLDLREESHRIRSRDKFTLKDWREHRWGYYRMIEIVDRRIGQILQTLREIGQEENTIIVFTSDHGDACGAHSWHQKRVFYDESSRVPLILCLPGQKEAAVVDQPAQIGIDLFPTLCDAAGIDLPPELPGASLLREESQERPYVVVETRFQRSAERDPDGRGVEGRMVRSKRFKYCVYDQGAHRESLVDMEHDPLEMCNLARRPEYLEELNRHRGWLAEFASATGDRFPLVPPDTAETPSFPV